MKVGSLVYYRLEFDVMGIICRIKIDRSGSERYYVLWWDLPDPSPLSHYHFFESPYHEIELTLVEETIDTGD